MNFSNFSLPSALVKMSTICLVVEQCLKWVVLASTWYRIRWYFVLMCLVRSWNMGFLANLIVEVLSTRIGFEFTCFSFKFSSIFLSHTISFVASVAATYSTSIMEFSRIDCLISMRLLLIQDSWDSLKLTLCFLYLHQKYNQAEVIYLRILESKILSSLQVI